MLEVSRINKAFGGLLAVDDCSFQLEEGVVGLIGPNGAGKTTLFDLITGFTRPDSGRIRFKGEEITALAPYKIVSRGITRTFQLVKIFKQLSVLENVLLGFKHQTSESLTLATIIPRHTRPQERIFIEKAREIIASVGLEGKEDVPAENLSYGEQKMLEIGRSLATEPALLLLDEPIAGVDLRTVARMTNLFETLKKNGTIVFVTEHRLREITPLCDSLIVMDRGKIIMSGTPEEALKAESVIRTYFGGGITAGS